MAGAGRRRWFVTGGRGLLGRHLRRALDDGDVAGEVVAPSSAELDVRDRPAVLRAVRDAQPHAVVHLAYRRDERDTIVEGTANVARAAVDVDARLVHLSTDVVFDDRDAPWTESDAPCPRHEYGRSKAAAEAAVRAIAPHAVVLRTSLLYGEDDLAPIQDDVIDVLDGREQMRFFTDEIRCPAPALDVARAVVRVVGELPDVRGPLHVAGPEAVSRADLARRFARHLGRDERAVPTASAVTLGLDRSRPLRVVLDTSRAATLGLVVRSVDEALSP
jgi:dTDP-4-dehydrorhamnose reductase